MSVGRWALGEGRWARDMNGTPLNSRCATRDARKGCSVGQLRMHREAARASSLSKARAPEDVSPSFTSAERAAALLGCLDPLELGCGRVCA